MQGVGTHPSARKQLPGTRSAMDYTHPAMPSTTGRVAHPTTAPQPHNAKHPSHSLRGDASSFPRVLLPTPSATKTPHAPIATLDPRRAHERARAHARGGSGPTGPCQSSPSSPLPSSPLPSSPLVRMARAHTRNTPRTCTHMRMRMHLCTCEHIQPSPSTLLLSHLYCYLHLCVFSRPRPRRCPLYGA